MILAVGSNVDGCWELVGVLSVHGFIYCSSVMLLAEGGETSARSSVS